MNADMWIFFLVPLLICVSSNGQQTSVQTLQKDSCKMYTITASLGSSALLPCIFSTTGLGNVTWAYVVDDLTRDVVQLASNRRVQFLEHRQGRVKVFPNQASVWNFSISITELEKFDLGSYTCKEGKNCIEVELQETNKGEQFDEGLCETNTLRAPLGSSVLLPCNLSTNPANWVTWTHLTNPVPMVRLSSNGRVQFPEHRHGRVKAFPNQASVGNFSIGMDELKDSDLGTYRCRKRNKCFQVDLLDDKRTLDASAWLLICICVGVAVLILLGCVGYYSWVKCPGLWSKRKQDKTEGGENFEGASAPPHEAHQNQTGVDNNRQVYENDGEYLANRNPVSNHSGPAGDPQHQDQTQPHQSDIGIYPNLNEFRFERVESHRTRQRFHIELFSRLRQASINRHFYVNQHEINRQQVMAAQAQKQKAASLSDCQYQNPIYNQSTEQLNQM